MKTACWLLLALTGMMMMIVSSEAGKVELRQTGRYLPKRSKSCYDVLEYQGQKYNGVQQIFLGINEFHAEVYCDMETREGGWTVIQRRRSGRVSFDRDWYDYSAGFGDLYGDFWLGNENIHMLTMDGRQRLRIDMTDWRNNKYYVEYDHFRVGPESRNYTLECLGSSIANTDYLFGKHLNAKFSTRDHDKDGLSTRQCGAEFHSGWWFRNIDGECCKTNLNGRYGRQNMAPCAGVQWKLRGRPVPLKSVEMKVRPYFMTR